MSRRGCLEFNSRVEEDMAGWVKNILFGRQLSHGSDTENHQTFEEAFQPPPLNMEIQQVRLINE